MANKTVRVKMLRHVQGEATDSQTNEKEILTKGSVVEISEVFGAELVMGKAAEYVDEDAKLVKAPLHPKGSEPAAQAAS